MSRRQPYVFRATEADAEPVWRSLEEKRDPKAAADKATAEFPEGVVDPNALLGRRSFMAVGGAGAALALSGCDVLRRPEENIYPFANGAEYVVPGVPLHFATTVRRGGEPVGVIAESHEGRPTKLEGNGRHPMSFGSTDVWIQADVMNLYDPDRARSPGRRAGDGALEDVSWAQLDEALAALAAKHREDRGRGLHVLTQPTTSPSMLRVREALLAAYPEARIHVYAPVSDRNAREGTRIAFGEPLQVLPDLRAAKVVLALDSDFLATEDGAIRLNRLWADTRRIDSAAEAANMSRFYMVEADHTITGSNADHRLRLPSTEIERYVRALCRHLEQTHGVSFGAASAALGTPSTDGIPEAWLTAVGADLARNRGQVAVLAGRAQPPRVHALVALLNEALGATGTTIQYVTPTDPLLAEPIADLRALVEAMKGGASTVLILGGNPAYDAPADLGFVEALARVETSIHVSTHRDETSVLCTWFIPRSHELESWGDHRAIDGTLSIQQPLIAPLWGSRSDLEVLAALAGERNWRGHPQVRKTLRAMLGDGVGFEQRWREVLQSGVIGDAPTPSRPTLRPDAVAEAVRGGAREAGAYGPEALEVRFVPDVRLYDGRYGNNLWLLELPDQMSKLSWDNAAYVSPATARALGVKDGDIVELTREGAPPLEIAVKLVPGHADGSVTLPLGWGRKRAGRWGTGQGFDVYPFRTAEAFDFATGVKARRTGKSYWFAQTQEHHSMEGRPLAIRMTTEEYRENPEAPSFATVDMSIPPLWDQVDYDQVAKWGMTIDLSTCTGCNACVIACQAENNIPSVGKREIARGREMYWLRIDRYFVGEEDDPRVASQPIGCQHCEEAPCENVCPVNATVHSHEGLNDMAYNRCIGTRYCMNNCPYKVRRFNYFNWHGTDVPETKKMQFNPNVTVRYRGVMEKCTYCVQRIQRAKYYAKIDGRRPLRDGEVVTACQQACPARAITFGNLNDPEAQVTRWATIDRRYHLLAEVGTQPRTTFLAHIRNTNPEMEA